MPASQPGVGDRPAVLATLREADESGADWRIGGIGDGRVLDPLGPGLDFGRKASRPRSSVSFLRLLMAIVMLMVYGYFHRGLAWPLDAGPRIWRMLAFSGFLGYCVSDLCLFKAFLVIGPRLSLLMTSLTPPMAVLISRMYLGGKHLGGQEWLAMFVTLAGVLWVVLEQPVGDEHPHSLRQLRYGLFLAIVSASTQAVAAVLAKDGVADYDPAASALIRILGAVMGYVVLITLAGRWRPVTKAALQGKPMLIVFAGAIVGTSIGMTTYMMALQNCHVGVVATILATIPVMILPFSHYLYRERVESRGPSAARSLPWPAWPC